MIDAEAVQQKLPKSGKLAAQIKVVKISSLKLSVTKQNLDNIPKHFRSLPDSALLHLPLEPNQTENKFFYVTISLNH